MKFIKIMLAFWLTMAIVLPSLQSQNSPIVRHNQKIRPARVIFSALGDTDTLFTCPTGGLVFIDQFGNKSCVDTTGGIGGANIPVCDAGQYRVSNGTDWVCVDTFIIQSIQINKVSGYANLGDILAPASVGGVSGDIISVTAVNADGGTVYTITHPSIPDTTPIQLTLQELTATTGTVRNDFSKLYAEARTATSFKVYLEEFSSVAQNLRLNINIGESIAEYFGSITAADGVIISYDWNVAKDSICATTSIGAVYCAASVHPDNALSACAVGEIRIGVNCIDTAGLFAAMGSVDGVITSYDWNMAKDSICATTSIGAVYCAASVHPDNALSACAVGEIRIGANCVDTAGLFAAMGSVDGVITSYDWNIAKDSICATTSTGAVYCAASVHPDNALSACAVGEIRIGVNCVDTAGLFGDTSKHITLIEDRLRIDSSLVIDENGVIKIIDFKSFFRDTGIISLFSSQPLWDFSYSADGKLAIMNLKDTGTPNQTLKHFGGGVWAFDTLARDTINRFELLNGDLTINDGGIDRTIPILSKNNGNVIGLGTDGGLLYSNDEICYISSGMSSFATLSNTGNSTEFSPCVGKNELYYEFFATASSAALDTAYARIDTSFFDFPTKLRVKYTSSGATGSPILKILNTNQGFADTATSNGGLALYSEFITLSGPGDWVDLLVNKEGMVVFENGGNSIQAIAPNYTIRDSITYARNLDGDSMRYEYTLLDSVGVTISIALDSTLIEEVDCNTSNVLTPSFVSFNTSVIPLTQIQGINTSYSDLKLATVSNDTLTLNGTNLWGSSGATGQLMDGNGSVSLHTGTGAFGNISGTAFGLGDSNADGDRANITYCIYFNISPNQVRIYENGVLNASIFGTYQDNQLFSVKRTVETIEYQKDGITFYTSTIPATFDASSRKTLSEAAEIVCVWERNGLNPFLNTTDSTVADTNSPSIFYEGDIRLGGGNDIIDLEGSVEVGATPYEQNPNQLATTFTSGGQTFLSRTNFSDIPISDFQNDENLSSNREFDLQLFGRTQAVIAGLSEEIYIVGTDLSTKGIFEIQSNVSSGTGSFDIEIRKNGTVQTTISISVSGTTTTGIGTILLSKNDLIDININNVTGSLAGLNVTLNAKS